MKIEAMLLDWSETARGGCKIVLQLAAPDELEPFKSMTLKKGHVAGQRLMIDYYEIGDDELPVTESPERNKGGPLSILAARLGQQDDFQQWILRQFGYKDGHADGETAARGIILEVCGIASRRELDHNDEAARKFEALIRRPFVEYRRNPYA